MNMKNKKYVVYERLNKYGGGKSFDNAKDACKWAKEVLADYGFTMFKDNGETWEDVFEADLVSILYDFVFLILLLYCYLLPFKYVSYYLVFIIFWPL